MTNPRSISRLRMPRLLPVTIVVMAAVLVIKSGAVVQAATASAAPAAAEPAKPAAASPHGAAPAPATAKPEPPPQAAVAACTPSEPVISDSERQLLTDLRRRRLELDSRETALAAREASMAAVDNRLAGRVTELTALQQRLETLERDRHERDESSWRGLVKLYESMKPKDAALIFNDLDLPVLLPVVDRMKDAKAGQIFAAMQPDRARQLTAELAQLRLKSNSLEGRGVDSGAKPVPGGSPPANTPKTSPKP